MTESDPGPRATLVRAITAQREGRLAEAERDLLAVAEQGYNRAEVLGLLAGLAEADGRIDVALARWDAALAADPGSAVALIAKAGVLRRHGRADEAADFLAAAAVRRPGERELAMQSAVALAETGRAAAAAAALADAVGRWPDDPALTALLRRISPLVVPPWHIPMMNDAARNDAFDRAIRRAVAAEGPDARVLDIGTGSGLLAMMAARAGAAAVLACEAEPAIAAVARRIVAHNGYADRIVVAPLHSTRLSPEAGLGRPADILVSEVLSSSVLSEGVLATFEDAIRRLLRPGARIIPRAVTALGCLAGGAQLESLAVAGMAAGFDLSAFGALAPPRLPILGRWPEWQRLSPTYPLVRFDLTAAAHLPAVVRLPMQVAATGVAVGVVQWMHLDLDDETAFANPPATVAGGGWQQVLHCFPAPLAVVAGQQLDLMAGHDRAALVLAPADRPLRHRRGRRPPRLPS